MMKIGNGIWVQSFLLVVVFLLLLPGCAPPADPVLPTLTTIGPGEITASSVTLGGNFTDDGGAVITERGICWNTSPGPTIANGKIADGNGTGSITHTLSGLHPGTIYYVRVYATNSVGTAYGNEVSFTTLANLPTIVNTQFYAITKSEAQFSSDITSDGGAAVTAKGVCWNTAVNPTLTGTKTIDGTGIGSFTSKATNLTPNTTYFARGYATNAVGTSYSDNVTFKTLSSNPQDADGNSYLTVTIGTQTWFAENLKTTKFNDGTPIPIVPDPMAWASLTTPGYCWYLNDAASYRETYGALYNWFTVSSGKLCPLGWHVPSNGEWTTLANYLGGESIAGGKMKEAGTIHWQSPNVGATNESGFSALPGGYRVGIGSFGNIENYCYLWSSEESTASFARIWWLDYRFNNLIPASDNKYFGFSVRCLKD